MSAGEVPLAAEHQLSGTLPALLDPVRKLRTDERGSILMNWRDFAACLDEDPELFFPVGNTDPAFLQIERARIVCLRCEVVETCLEWAIESGQDAGVWGGLSSDQRRNLKRRIARTRLLRRGTPHLAGIRGN